MTTALRWSSLSRPPQPALGADPADVSTGSTRGGRLLRVAGGALVLGFLVWQLGTGPFVDGLRATTPWAVVAALAVTAAATGCSAVRWSLVSASLGTRLPVRTAYVAYYRSMLVNATLPGGVVGDVHRGVRHGLRGVVWERSLGLLVLAALTGLAALPSPYRWAALLALGGLCAFGGLLVLLSAGAVAGHLAVFLLAAHSVGVGLSSTELVPVGLVVLLGSAIPLNVAGWGPREGVAAWAFTVAGAAAADGLTVSVTFGVLAMVSTLPGLFALGSRRG